MAAFDEAVPEAEPRKAPFQPALFTTRELGRVVPIESYRPTPSSERRARAQEAAALHQQSPMPRQASPLPRQAKAEPKVANPVPAENRQQQLAFAAAAASGATAAPATKARPIHTDPRPAANAPVAIPVHRLMAGAIDAAIVLVAVAMFAAVVHFMIGLEAFGSYTFPALGLLAGVFGVGYKLLWAFAEFDSPGQVWCQLRLLNFDGQKPSRNERIERIGWACVSVLPACLGLIWALVDEETLSWTDHSSQTFLTSFTSPNPVH